VAWVNTVPLNLTCRHEGWCPLVPLSKGCLPFEAQLRYAKHGVRPQRGNLSRRPESYPSGDRGLLATPSELTIHRGSKGRWVRRRELSLSRLAPEAPTTKSVVQITSTGEGVHPIAYDLPSGVLARWRGDP